VVVGAGAGGGVVASDFATCLSLPPLIR
jgi:hypothetical protein